jgi:WD40 repeat protein
MSFDEALAKILNYLKENRGATNRVLIDLINGDTALFEKVREHLIFNDMAEDKKGAGLTYLQHTIPDNRSVQQNENKEDLPGTKVSKPDIQTFKIFISYGRKDTAELANKIAKDLTGLGHKVWLDKEQIKTGVSWEEQIEEAILSSEIFISLLSPHAVRRPDGVCLDEISMARYNNRRIIPLMVINCRPPLGIYRLDWLDMQDWNNSVVYEKTIQKIVHLIQQKDYEVEGINTEIFNILKPIDFKLDIYRHVKDFVGREWILDDIGSWIERSKEKLLFITGDPGSGKTALMARLIQVLSAVGAYHFCIAKYETSLIPDKFIHSIASQLATQIPEFRELLSNLNLQTIAFQETGTLMKQLIVEPLSLIQREGPLIIIIDALDEALYYGKDNIVKLLYNWLDEFPSWVRLIVTSRKVTEILSLFDYYKPNEIDVSRKENTLDIKHFVEGMLTQNNDFSLEKENIALITDKILIKSEGIFLYAKSVVQNLLSKTIRLADIEYLPPGLNGIYETNFDRLFSEYVKFEGIKDTIEIILAAFKPLTIEELALINSIEELELRKRINKISAFFPEKDGTISAFHKSFADWLSGSSGKRHKYLCDINKGHLKIASFLSEQMSNEQTNDYLIQYLPKHLFYSGQKKETQLLLSSFKYLEKRCALREIYRFIEDFKLVLSLAPAIKDEGFIANSLLWDDARHDYESGVFVKELTISKIVMIIFEFLFKHAELIQLYGNISGFLKQLAYNEGLVPLVFQFSTEELHNFKGFLLTDFFLRKFDPFPSVSKLFYEHKLGISDLSVSKDGTRLVSASFDKSVKLWDLNNGECIKTLKVDSNVETVAIAWDASFIAAAGQISNNSIIVFNSGLDNELYALEGHSDTVGMIKLSENNQRLVSCSSDKSIRVWDLKGRSVIFERYYHDAILCCSISRDGSNIALSTKGDLIEVWNIDFEVLLFSKKHEKKEVRELLLSPDNKELIIAGGKDKKTEVWDLYNQKMKYAIEGHGYITYCMFLDKCKNTLITGGLDKYLRIWDFKTGNLTKIFESHSRVTRRIAATDDLNVVVTGGGWNSDYNIRLWDIKRSMGISCIDSNDLTINAVFSYEPKNLIIGATRKTIFSISTISGEKKVIKDNLSIQLIHLINSTLFVSLQDASVLSFNLDTGEWSVFFRNMEVVTAFTIISANNWIIGDWKGNVLINGMNNLRSYDRLSRLKIKQILHNDLYFIVLGYDDQFHFINFFSGQIEFRYKHPVRITSNVIFIDENIFFGDMKGDIGIYNVSQKSIKLINDAHEAEITSIEFTEKPGRLISGCSLGLIKVWKPDMSVLLLDFKAHEGSVMSIRSLEEYYFMSVAGTSCSDHRNSDNETKDTSLKKWNILTGECAGIYPAGELVTAIYTDECGGIIIGQRDGLIYQFRNTAH